MPSWTAPDGARINYELFNAGGSFDRGAQPTLLLLPGLLGSVRTQWRSFLPQLTPHFRVLLPDLRGHGLSTHVGPRLEAEQMTADLLGLLDYLQVGSAAVAGYSLGGYLGLSLALRVPQRVAALALHATKFYWTPESVAQMHSQLDPEQLVATVPAYADGLAKEHGAAQWRVLVRQAADLVSMIHESGLREADVARLACPLLVSVGDRDELVTLPEALRLSRRAPAGSLLVLPGIRHPFPNNRPVPLVNTLLDFFARNST
jgi:pimeloyl-ACP methyl ester carboxylesterase